MDHRLAVRGFLENLLLQKGDVKGFADTDSLVNSGRLESVDTLELVIFLEEKYGIDFGDRGFDQNEFDSVNSIMAVIGAL